MKAYLALADGSVYEGEGFGAAGERSGEVVFTTGMTGYQEVLTDPSYRGQIVCMTYPLIGNYGVNRLDAEAPRPYVEGFVVREHVERPSSWRSEEPLGAYLARHGIVGIQGVDTRALTRKLRTVGTMPGLLVHGPADPAALAARAAALPGMAGQDLVTGLGPAAPYEFDEPPEEGGAWPPPRCHVVAYDFGIKRSILRELRRAGCRVTVVPPHTPADEALRLGPDGIFLSNGPGDPAALSAIVEEVRRLASAGRPLFGICLGHQLLGLALGGRTYKLKFGHRGVNQPVKDLATGRVEITTHNHGFAVDPASVPDDVAVTHVNLNDGTCEGLAHRRRPLFSVQYHPEAAAGPHDSKHLFARFVRAIEDAKG
ncbi:MAG TPA: glutamine-hydrolyzing carbamoyl-phosphate synthase small subunit [Thermodesulfobacteriota bacterium]|nr:glutamine-hydrolyzing carbamoyl-phosphate synthase small subunit [Thermodesulfobacteriota bacterium]